MRNQVIEDAEQYLSNNLEGDFQDFSGLNDPYLMFDGKSNASLLNKNKSNYAFNFSVKNNFSTTKKVVLCPAGLDLARVKITANTETGYLEDAVLLYDSVVAIQRLVSDAEAVIADTPDKVILLGSESGVAKTIVATPKNSTFTELISFVRNNPTLMSRIRISSDKPDDQFSLSMYTREVNPFKKEGEQNILLEKFFSRDQQQNFVEITDDIQFDNLNLVMLEIAPNSTANITLTASAIESSSKALAVKNTAAVKYESKRAIQRKR